MRHSRDFTAAVRGGAKSARPCLVVHLAGPVAGVTGPTRAGFVVSRAVGGSVVRHRVTRRLRALVAERLPGLPAGSRLVVRALPPAAGATSASLATDLDGALAGASRRGRTR
jgi:ribonuclease P protein component